MMNPRSHGGRPRLAGERTASGRLKTTPAAARREGGPTLSFEHAEALRRFGKDAERASASTNSEKRLDAKMSLEKASAVLPENQRAIVDLVVLRGRSLSDLAAASGQTVEALDQMLRQAANSLADHYQSGEAA